MNIDGFMDKAKEALGDNADQAEGLVDKAADQVKDRTPDGLDDKVDMGAAAAKDFIEKQRD